MTPDGDKAIEDLQVGDLVLAAPEDDPEVRPSFKRVEQLLSNSKPVMEIHLHGQVIPHDGRASFLGPRPRLGEGGESPDRGPLPQP